MSSSMALAPIVVSALALAIWIALLIARDGFWQARERDDVPSLEPEQWPSVVAVVPARDEAEVIGRTISSLQAQDYPGYFSIVLVDDNSSDGTGDIARRSGGKRLEVIQGMPLPAGWTGKLWAVSQGIDYAAGHVPDYLLLTDADIGHASDNLRNLVARSVSEKLVLNSLMARLSCMTFAEKMLIPAFVFFFQMLYPFSAVNDRSRKIAGAAGGCMLISAPALTRAGGIEQIRGAIIDDCAMGALMKAQGPIRLSLTDRALSIRPYQGFGEIARMISRSAYAQLRYSPLLLLGTLFGMGLVYLAPPLFALFGQGVARWLGLGAWLLMALSFQPMLRFYRRSPLWGLALPIIATFYAGCTFASAWASWRGRGGMWKGRAQAVAPR
jgi:hopene-associated glycosyltransferase HpnB